MNMQPVKSSNIESIGYDEKTGTLAVKFKGSGQTYHYDEVPKDAHTEMLKAPSVGKFFNQHLIGKHAHKKVS